VTPSIRVQNEELVGVRDTSRSLPNLIRRLETGEQEKFVLMRHGKMVGVLLSFEAYEELVDGK
jgi:translation initiation factor 2B subunit (eIF-2B alpha/beta/delta family)